MSKITEKTLIPLSLLAIIIGGVIWLTTMYSQGTANAESIRDIRSDNKGIQKMFLEIKEDIGIIKGILEND